MHSQLENNSLTVTANPNGIFVQNKGYNTHHIHKSPSLILSGNIENESYRLDYNNHYQPRDVSATLIESSMYSCFLGFIQTNKSNGVGPYILNITPNEKNKSIPILDLDINFIEEDFYITNNQTQAKIMKTIEKKLEEELYKDELTLQFGENSKNLLHNLKETLSFEKIRFKITPLPFDNFFINSSNKKHEIGIDCECQTTNFQENVPNLSNDIINVLKDQIEVLKEQNQLLRKEQKTMRRGSSIQREYVIRKRPESVMKSTRQNSICSADTIFKSASIKSAIKDNPKSITNLTILTNENSSLQEMLQEYMMENEALREVNMSLEERRVSHNSEMISISRRNKELSLQVEEFNKKIKENYKYNSLQQDLLEPQNENNQNKIYPITYDRPTAMNNKNSYLYQYDIQKNKQQNETVKHTIENIPNINKSKETNVIKLDESISKTSNRNITNECLLEELSRIDETIKDHIRKKQFNDTLRTMGKKQSPRKN